MRLLGWRAWVDGIHVDTDGVTVAGFLVSRRVAWNDIDHFAVLPLGDYPWVGHMVLRDGRKLGTYGIGAPGRPQRDRYRLQVQEPVDERNAALEQWRATNTLASQQAGRRVDRRGVARRRVSSGVTRQLEFGWPPGCIHTRAVAVADDRFGCNDGIEPDTASATYVQVACERAVPAAD